jgi:hypothetical protein
MRPDVILILTCFIFLFAAWFYTGGPTRPIARQGPFITPITDVGVESKGYGSSKWESVGSSLKNAYSGTFSRGTSANELQQQLNDLKEDAAYSKYHKNVRLSGGAVSATDPKKEYLTLSISGKEDIDITGWRLVSTSTSERISIPRGVAVANKDGSGTRSTIIVSPGDRVILTSGRSPLSTSFKENSCSGYLANSYTFAPSMSTYRCPDPVDELRTFYTAEANTYVACKSYLENATRCDVEEPPRSISSSCRSFVSQRLSYSGCLAGHRNDSNFDGTTWRVYFEESDELWEKDHARIRLLDTEGKVVDVYTY